MPENRGRTICSCTNALKEVLQPPILVIFSVEASLGHGFQQRYASCE